MTQAKVGRPLATIDWERAAKLAQMGASGQAIASEFGLCRNTMYDRCLADLGYNFSTFLANNKEKGDNSILEAQYSKACDDKDSTLLIWLGKCRLGQSEQKTSEKAKASYVSFAKDYD